MSKKFIFKLQQAHAIEIGAQFAYQGHIDSLPKDSQDRKMIEDIREDEIYHMYSVAKMLKELNSQPSIFLNFILFFIGSLISIACHFMGYRAAMWGAKIMEVMGTNIYKKLAQIARDEGYPWMGVDLDYMQLQEKAHEEFFKSRLSVN